MPQVNGKKFPIYDLDTEQSLITRIAAILKSLPKYVTLVDFPLDETEQKEYFREKIQAVDHLKQIKQNARESTETFSQFLEEHPDILKKLDLVRDVLYPWLAYNQNLENLQKHGTLIGSPIIKSLIDGGYFKNSTDFRQFWENRRKNIKEDLEYRIESLIRDDENTRNLYEEFQKIDEKFTFSEFAIDRISIQFSLDIKDVSILEMFNNAILFEGCPFMYCKGYFKILKDFIPPEEWLKPGSIIIANMGADQETETLLTKVFPKTSIDSLKYQTEVSPLKYKEFADVFMRIQDNGRPNVYADLITEKQYLSQSEFIHRFLETFRGMMGDIAYDPPIKDKIVGIFYFPNASLDIYVFADLVMNNAIFSSLINIDESLKATKKKSENSQPWVQIHFEHQNTGKISARISQKIAEKADMTPELKAVGLQIGEPFIRVRARAKDEKSIAAFQEILSKLLVIYKNNYDEILKIYRKFIPTFGKTEKIKIVKKPDRINDEAPEIFVENYTRKCTEARMPRIISETEAKKVKKDGGHIMYFPRAIQDEEPHYPSDGAPQKILTCPNPEYPYPGLQVNKLPNAEQYPYVPCCFKNNQNEKKGVYRHYFYGEPLDVKEKKQQDLIITDKFLGIDKFGVLPENLVQFFKSIDTDPDYKYIRVGVERSDANKSSFLNSVMVALDDDTKLLEKSIDKRRERIISLRKLLSQKSIAPIARQCCYEVPIKQLREKIANPEYYLEPRRFIQLLEKYFDCSIFIFDQTQLVLPNYTQSYYEYRRHNNRCIFVYEHMGSESDHAKYPQTELIVRWNTKSSEDIQYTFNASTSGRGSALVAQKINDIFSTMKFSYTLNRKVTDIIFPLKETILSQVIDTYGKTRQLTIEYSSKKFFLMTSPIAPLPVPEIVTTTDDLKEINEVSLKFAVEFLHRVGKIVSQTVVNEQTAELNGIIGNVEVHIPVKKSDPDRKILKVYGNVQFPVLTHDEKDVSQLDMYNRNKKIARYLSEYVLWLFSRYMAENGIFEIADKHFSTFSKTEIVVDENWNYSNISKIFSTESAVMKNKKLVLTSNELLKRLIYVLRLYAQRNFSALLSYKDRNVITNYYENIYDFTHIPTQVILFGEDTVDRWIHENRTSYVLMNRILPGQHTPYFFRNELIHAKNVYLAQNTVSFRNAIAICSVWNRRGYNIGFDVHDEHDEDVDEKNFELYSYVNPSKITQYSHSNGKNPALVIGYKISKKPFFTALLSLNIMNTTNP